MPGTLIIKRSIYAWNIDNKGDYICLEHKSHWGPDMPGTLFNEKHRKAFQAYLVPNVTNVPGIYSPLYYQCSRHI